MSEPDEGSRRSEEDQKKTVRAPITDIGPTEIRSTEDSTEIGDSAELIPGYRIESRLGEGGMGVVYKAVQVSLNRKVAIKVMKVSGDTDTGFEARFRREALAGARLNHPHIVSVYDHGSAHGTVYMVLEFVEGRDCGQILRDGGPFDEQRAFEIARDTVLGLSHAHEHGVIHRDIKPGNIMVAEGKRVDARRRAAGVAKITDFGIASLRRQKRGPELTELTMAGMVIGTPGYMSPEQSMGQEVDFRADIYSLGCTLYYLMTGAPPYQGQTAIEVFHNKMTQQVPDPRDLRGGIGAGSVAVISKMMARAAEDRYQDYESLLDDVEAVLAEREPATGEVPEPSRSIAPPRGGSPPSDALDKTVPSNQSTVDMRGAALKQMRAKEAEAVRGGRKKALVLGGGAAAVLAAAVAGYLLFGRGDAGDDALADAKGFLGALEAQAPEDLLDDLVGRQRRFESMIEGLSASDRSALSLRFDRAVAEALARTAAERMAALERLYSRGSWDALAAAVEDAKELHRRAGVEAPPRLGELAEMVAAAAEGAGAREREAWAEILAATDPGRRRELIEDFVATFPFSPDLEEARRMATSAPAGRSPGKALDELVEEVAGLDDETFVSERVRLREEATALLGRLEGAELRRRERDVEKAFSRRANAVVETGCAEAETLLAAADWAAFGSRVQELSRLAREELMLEPVPPRLVELEGVRQVAVEQGLGSAERAAWAAIGAQADPVARIAALEDFLERYSFSPALEEARERLEASRAEAPRLVLKTQPAGARLSLGDRDLGKSPFEGPVLRGEVEVVAASSGFFDTRLRFRHEDVETREFRLWPRPEKELVVPDQNRRLPFFAGAGNPVLRGQDSWSISVPGASFSRGEASYRFSTNDSKEGWAVNSVPLKPFLAHRILGSPEGFRVQTVLRHESGAAEVRLAEGEHLIAVGVDSEGLYLRLRNGSEDFRQRLPVAYSRNMPVVLEWHGDVLVVLDGAREVIGSLRPAWKPGDATRFMLAVSEGACTFEDMFIWAMRRP